MQQRVHVRRRGGLIELRVDGTLASAHHAAGASAGPVWEALAAPLLALPPERRRSVLVLGLGGGTAARIVRSLAPLARIVGVERNPDVAEAALGHFGLGSLDIELVVDDARAFLEADRGRYDAILEDVFVGPNRTIRKPDWLPEPGLTLALGRLAAGGVYACNTIHEGPAMTRALLRHRQHLVSIAVAGFHNRVLVAGPPSLSAATLRRAIVCEPRLARTLPRLALRTLVR